ncbi:MAG: hypothetical protein ACQERR_09035, partial [Pseudomonadota bacterium]
EQCHGGFDLFRSCRQFRGQGLDNTLLRHAFLVWFTPLRRRPERPENSVFYSGTPLRGQRWTASRMLMASWPVERRSRTGRSCVIL